MTQEQSINQKHTLFNQILGSEKTLDDALQQASSKIAAIGERKKNKLKESRLDGVSITQLYDYSAKNK